MKLTVIRLLTLIYGLLAVTPLWAESKSLLAGSLFVDGPQEKYRAQLYTDGRGYYLSLSNNLWNRTFTGSLAMSAGSCSAEYAFTGKRDGETIQIRTSIYSPIKGALCPAGFPEFNTQGVLNSYVVIKGKRELESSKVYGSLSTVPVIPPPPQCPLPPVKPLPQPTGKPIPQRN